MHSKGTLSSISVSLRKWGHKHVGGPLVWMIAVQQDQTSSLKTTKILKMKNKNHKSTNRKLAFCEPRKKRLHLK
jgi:hypothetical protein